MRQFLIVGLGKFGASVSTTLAEKGAQVLAIDMREDLVKAVSHVVANAVQLDATDEKALKSVGIDVVDVAVVSVGEKMEASILITLLLRELGIRHIVTKAVSDMHAKVLKRVGATTVVFPERDMGVRVANSLLSPELIEHIGVSEEYSIVEINPPYEFIGKSLQQINMRAKYGLNVIAIKKKTPESMGDGTISLKEKIEVVPGPDEAIQEGDVLIVIGDNKSIKRIMSL